MFYNYLKQHVKILLCFALYATITNEQQDQKSKVVAGSLHFECDLIVLSFQTSEPCFEARLHRFILRATITKINDKIGNPIWWPVPISTVISTHSVDV